MDHKKYFEEIGKNKLKEFNFYYPEKCETSEIPLLIHYCPDLESIELPLDITEEQISLLKHFKNLHTISLEMVVALSKESLLMILGLPNLRSLELVNNKIGENLFKEIAKCQQLNRLDLSACDYVLDEDIESLSLLKNLESLGLCSSDMLTDEGVKGIVAFPRLKELGLGSCRKLTNESIKIIGNLTRLEVLNIQRLGIDIEGVRYLRSLTNLKVLNLRFCKKLDDEGMQIITELKNLEQLALSNCWNVSERGFINLKICAHLTHLDVSYTQFSETNLMTISALPNLGSLCLRSCEKLSFKHVESMKGFENLIDLDLSYCDSVEDVVLKYLSSLRSLRTLDVSSCNRITDIGLEYLSHSPNLSHLNLFYCENISEKGLYTLAKNLKCLTMLRVSSGKLISKHELEAFKHRYPTIEIIC